jgi:non-heme chloroperoxidase
VPTLLVRGGLSDVLSEAGAQQFLALCPASEYVNVADAAHMVAGERNDVFGQAVVEFLGRRVHAGLEGTAKGGSAKGQRAGPAAQLDR